MCNDSTSITLHGTYYSQKCRVNGDDATAITHFKNDKNGTARCKRKNKKKLEIFNMPLSCAG